MSNNRNTAWGGTGGDGTATVVGSGPQGQPVLNVKWYGAAGDGVTDDTAAINAALADVPTYTSGQGTAVVFFPAGTYVVSSSITVWNGSRHGLTLRGDGTRASFIKGSVAGPILTNDSGTQEIYCRVEGLFVQNTSTNIAARAIQTNNMNELVLRDSTFQSSATGSGSCAAQLDFTYDLLVENCAFDGASNTDHGFTANTQNVATYFRCSFRDTKGGMKLAFIKGLNIIGCSYQALTGSTTDGFDGCINLANCTGGYIQGNYLESCNTPFFTGTSGSGSFGFVVGGNFITNAGGSAAISGTGMNKTTFQHNHVIPGANNTNISVVDGGNSDQCTFQAQSLASGSGSTVALSSSTNYYLLSNNALFQARNSVQVLQKAGTPVDGDFTITPPNGTLAVDTTNSKIYARIGGTWKGVTVA